MRIRSLFLTESAFAPPSNCVILNGHVAIGTKWQETERVLPRLSSQIECRREQCLLTLRARKRLEVRSFG